MSQNSAFEIEANGARIRIEGDQEYVEKKLTQYSREIQIILDSINRVHGEQYGQPSAPRVSTRKKTVAKSRDTQELMEGVVDSKNAPISLTKDQLVELRERLESLKQASIRLTQAETVFQIGVYIRAQSQRSFTHVDIESCYRQLVATRLKLPVIKNRDAFSRICRDLHVASKPWLWFERAPDGGYAISVNGEHHLTEIEEEVSRARAER